VLYLQSVIVLCNTVYSMYFTDSHPSVALLCSINFEIYISVSPRQLLPELSVRRSLCPGRSYVPRNKAIAGVSDADGRVVMLRVPLC